MINSFTHRCVRDLAWVVASPPLVSGIFENDEHHTFWWNHAKCSQEFVDCLPALQTLNENPTALISHLERIKGKRLGLRFEGLVSFWLSSISPNYKLLTQNIQLNEVAGDSRSRTIGEVDFIVEEVASEKIIHLEVAVKFYLGTAPFDDAYRWFGTNTEDQLGRKVDHLQRHQTQLLIHHPEQILFSIDERHCLLKGRLFYPSELEPASHQDTVLACPDFVTENHLRGRYVFFNEEVLSSQTWVQDLVRDRTKLNLVQLNKSEWLAVLKNKDIEGRKIQKTFVTADRASCYVILEQDQKGRNDEVERVFCLPETFVFPE